MSRDKHKPFMGWIEVETEKFEMQEPSCWDSDDMDEHPFAEALPPEALSRLAQKAHQRQKGPKHPRQWR